jgi:hypothetical protein
MLGAAAFNPDSGLLVHSEPVWRVFGLAAYLGWALLPLLALAGLARLALRGLTRSFTPTPETQSRRSIPSQITCVGCARFGGR